MVAVSSIGFSGALSNVFPFAPPAQPRRDWAAFDNRCLDLVEKRIDFETFCRASSADFDRLVRIATRKRRPPASMGCDDLAALAKTHAWHYLFVHTSKTKVVGFDPGRGTTPGAYVRWNVSRRLQKDLSLARGENQHRRDVKTSAPEVPMPENFDPSSDRELFDSLYEHRSEMERWKATYALTLREHLVLQAVIDSNGDDRVAACSLLKKAAYRSVAGVTNEKEAVRAIGTVIGDIESRRLRAAKEKA